MAPQGVSPTAGDAVRISMRRRVERRSQVLDTDAPAMGAGAVLPALSAGSCRAALWPGAGHEELSER